MKKFNCEEISDAIVANIKKEIGVEKARWKNVTLFAISVGDNEASKLYLKAKKNMCEKCGIAFKHINFDEDIDVNMLYDFIELLNNNDEINGIIVQLPLPDNLKPYQDIILNSIDSEKDVDGFKIDSEFIPCTPLGIIEIIKTYIDTKTNLESIRDLNICIIGRGKTVGSPLAAELIRLGATVSVCNSHTNNEIKQTFCEDADVIVTAVGKASSLDAVWLKEYGRQLIVDVGISKFNGKQVGDFDHPVDFYNDDIYYTPWTKGVGLMTTTMLCYATLSAYKEQNTNKEFSWGF